MAKYNRALDLMLTAAALHRSGKAEKAAAMFDAAARDGSLTAAAALVNSFNKKALGSAAKTAPTKTVKAAAWPFVTETAAEVPHTENEEYGVAPDENDLREVQEADAVDGDDFDFAEEKQDEEAGLDDDLEGMGLEEKKDETARARFERALANLSRSPRK